MKLKCKIYPNRRVKTIITNNQLMHIHIYTSESVSKCIKLTNVVTKFDQKGRWGFLNITTLIWIFFHGQLLEASLEKKLIWHKQSVMVVDNYFLQFPLQITSISNCVDV